ncbi:MAG TPA: L-lysine dehydrogenase, partial [Emticicia sp.]
MKNVLVIGMGKVGSLVGVLLSKRFAVMGMDKRHPNTELPFDVILGDVNDLSFLEKTIPSFDTVVSAMPYNL